MYILNLYNNSNNKVLDPSLAPDVIFSTIVQAVNYAIHHCIKNNKRIIDFNEAAPGVVNFDDDDDEDSEILMSYRVVPLIHVTSTQYGLLMTMNSEKLVAGRIVVSADDLDDLVSKLLYGVRDHAIVKPALRLSTIAALIAALPEEPEEAFAWGNLPDTYIYTDIAALRLLLATKVE